MEARLFSTALVAAALLACGANYRSENFIIHSSSSNQIAQELCAAAETYRRDLAIEWLGQELPPWREPCPINASRIAPHEGAGGKTSFYFKDGVPFGWDMEVYGTRERVLDSVLPHEVTHTIFATHFGRALPRWADEGGSTTVEHASEKAKQDSNLIHFLKNNRGIAFNRMFAMTEYPRDMLPLYSQGYSLSRFLIMHGGTGGKRKFIAYVGDGMRQNNWTKATREHYGYQSLSDLQIAWVEWVKKGSPALQPAPTPAPDNSLADNAIEPRGDEPNLVQPSRTRGMTEESPATGYEQPPRPTTFAAEPPIQGDLPQGYEQSSVARPTTGGWYAKQKDRPRGEPLTREPVSDESSRSGREPPRTVPRTETVDEPQQSDDNRPPLPGRKLLMEWSRQPRSLDEPAPIYAAEERSAALAASGTMAR